MLKYILGLLLVGEISLAADDGVDVLQGSTMVSQVDVPGSQASSGTIKLAQNKYRNFLYIRNLHATEAMYVVFSAQVSGNAGVRIAANSVWEPVHPPVDNIYLLSGSSTGVSATIIQGN